MSIEKTDFSRKYTKKILLAASLGLLIACVSVALVSVIPLYKQLKSQQVNNLTFAVKTRAMVIEEFLGKTIETTRQFTSRSKIREFLEKYNRGDISLEKLSGFSAPKLKDALKLSAAAVGITRFDDKGNNVVQVGYRLPDVYMELIEPFTKVPQVYGPFEGHDGLLIVVTAPILNREEVFVGMDAVLFEISELESIVNDATGMGQTGETLLGGFNKQGKFSSFFISRLSGDLDKESLILRHKKMAADILSIKHAKKNNSDIRFEESEHDLASYGNIKWVDWQVMVVMNKDELFRPITRQLFIILFIVALIIPIGLIGLTVLIRPFANKISDYVKQLHYEVQAKQKAEKYILDDKDRLFVTLNSIVEGVISTDINGNIKSINDVAEKLTGCNQQEALNQPVDKVFNIINQQTGDKCELNTDRILNSDESVQWLQNTTLVSQHLDQYPIEGNGSPIHDAQGNILGAVLVFKDITEKQRDVEEKERLQRELHQSQKMDALGKLTGGIAHDFNNILSIVLGNVDLAKLHHDNHADEKLGRYLNTIEKAAERARDLVTQMMIYSRNDQSESTVISVKEQINLEINLLGSLLPTSIHINVNYQDDLPDILIDPVKFQQVIMNLCLNAKDAMNDVGNLTISAKLKNIDNEECVTCHEIISGEWVEILVQDTGHGISEQTISQIFDPFYTTKEVGKGTGMGLSVVHSVVKSFGGHFLVDSILSKGTNIKLLFPPVKQDRENKYITEETKMLSCVTGKGQNILIVDDEPALAQAISDILCTQEYNTFPVTSANQALLMFTNNPDKFDMLITDQTMPDITGLELISEFRKIKSNFPIILATGYSDVATPSDAEELDIGFLQKPIRANELIDLIKSLFDK